MYTQYFGFKTLPFSVNPDRQFEFLSGGFLRSRESARRALRAKQCCIVISGPPGSGKSTLLDHLCSQARPDSRFLVLNYPGLEYAEYLSLICAQLGLHLAPEMAAETALTDYLTNRMSLDESLVLVIDEAQNLTDVTLRALFDLCLKVPRDKPAVQLLMAGSSTLQRKCQSLAKRYTPPYPVRFSKLSALIKDDISAYIRHRVTVAGGEKPDIFSDEAVELIALNSRGLPRSINAVCGYALLIAFEENVSEVSEEHVREAIENLAASQSGNVPATEPVAPVEAALTDDHPTDRDSATLVAPLKPIQNRSSNRRAAAARGKAKSRNRPVRLTLFVTSAIGIAAMLFATIYLLQPQELGGLVGEQPATATIAAVPPQPIGTATARPAQSANLAAKPEPLVDTVALKSTQKPPLAEQQVTMPLAIEPPQIERRPTTPLAIEPPAIERQTTEPLAIKPAAIDPQTTAPLAIQPPTIERQTKKALAIKPPSMQPTIAQPKARYIDFILAQPGLKPDNDATDPLAQASPAQSKPRMQTAQPNLVTRSSALDDAPKEAPAAVSSSVAAANSAPPIKPDAVTVNVEPVNPQPTHSDSARIAREIDFVVASGVRDRTPVGISSEFPAGRVYAYARVTAPRNETLTLKWFAADQRLISTLDLKVRTNLGGYRTYGWKTLAKAGAYTVRLYNQDGEAIGQREFTLH